jgi:DNA repair protein RadC
MSVYNKKLDFSPREKIRKEGVSFLSTQELLAVILGSGIHRVPVQLLAQQISEQILTHQKIQLSDLTSIRGVGEAKACQILAAIELVERLRPSGYPLLDSLQKVLNQVGELRYAQREQMVCLYLNTRMQLVHKETIAMGSVNQTVITPKDVFSVIKHHPVSFFILVHNHPSGDPTPSDEDLEFTRVMNEAGHLLGVELLDHAIVGQEKHYSLREHKQLETIAGR